MKICENCKRYPVFGKDKVTGIGYCKSCQYKRTDRDTRSQLQKALDKAKNEPQSVTKELRFPKKIHKGTFYESVLNSDWEKVEVNPGAGELWNWFVRQRERMVGVCSHCGGKSQKHDDKTFHYSIAHLFEKSNFPGIAQNDSNWIELCYYGESCHTNLDNKMLSLTDLNCFEEVVQKFVILYPLMTREEKRRVPSVLLTYLDAEI